MREGLSAGRLRCDSLCQSMLYSGLRVPPAPQGAQDSVPAAGPHLRVRGRQEFKGGRDRRPCHTDLILGVQAPAGGDGAVLTAAQTRRGSTASGPPRAGRRSLVDGTPTAARPQPALSPALRATCEVAAAPPLPELGPLASCRGRHRACVPGPAVPGAALRATWRRGRHRGGPGSLLACSAPPWCSAEAGLPPPAPL